jgi:hypothetical protein
MKKFPFFLSVFLLATAGNAQLINADFEQWDAPITQDIMTNKPTGWIWSDSFTSSLEQMFYNPPQADAQNNDYALTLSVWYHYGKDIALQTVPIDYRPEQLTGFFKYTHTLIEDTQGPVADTALVQVFLTKYNSIIGQLDTIGTGSLGLTQSDDYQPFEVNITYTSNELPEYLTIKMDPSLVKRYDDRYYMSVNEPVASFFSVDNLSLEGNVAVSVNNTTKENGIALYPNPATDRVTITLNERSDVVIYDVTGGLVESFVANATYQLDVRGYAAGIYIIKSQGEAVRFIKE